MTATALALLSVGSNLGDREANIQRGLELVGREAGVEVVQVSRRIETEPVGGPPQGRYLNAAAVVRTSLEPRQLLAALLGVEAALGRVRDVRWGPRELDLDLLLYADRRLNEPGLELPHPRMLERRFVLEPAAEVAAEWVHPVTGKTVGWHWRHVGHGYRPERTDLP